MTGHHSCNPLRLDCDHGPATEIREAGWAQVPWVGEDKQWPPDAEQISIELTGDQWELVLGELASSYASYVRRGDEVGRALGQDAAAALRTQLPRQS